MPVFNNNDIGSFFNTGTYSANKLGGLAATTTGTPVITPQNVSLASQIIGVGLTAQAAENQIQANAANQQALNTLNAQRVAAGMSPLTSLTQATLSSPITIIAIIGVAFLLLGKR